jgi:hypothetical protein
MAANYEAIDQGLTPLVEEVPETFWPDGAVDVDALQTELAKVIKRKTAFKSRALLKETLVEFGGLWGFTIVVDGNSCVCSYREKKRQAPPSELSPSKQRKHTNTMKVGCEFKINHSKADKVDGSIRISQMYLLHSDACRPSPNRLQEGRRKSGHYTKIAILRNPDLLQMLAEDPMSAIHLRRLLQASFPEAVAILAQDMTNIRLRAKLLMDKKVKGCQQMSQSRLLISILFLQE